jgi:hypothetical protein
MPTTLFEKTCAAGAAGALAIVVSCSSAVGPGGAPTTYHHCTPYYGNGCAGAQYSNFFQCDDKPGDKCVPAPKASPDPKQTVWCCEFACTRAPLEQDYRCTGGRQLYYCNSDAKVDAKAVGCVPGGSSSEICC